MKKIKKGDLVIVTTGKDKGRKGTVEAVLPEEYVLVEGINTAKKHIKANPNSGEKGGIKIITRPIHRSNVMYYDQANDKKVKLGIKDWDGKRVRYIKGTDEVIDI